jgi:hypothetical protein
MTYEPEPKQEDLTEATEEASIELQEADLERVAGGFIFTKIRLRD